MEISFDETNFNKEKSFLDISEKVIFDVNKNEPANNTEKQVLPSTFKDCNIFLLIRNAV